jgi:hypothetical protein
MRNRNTPFFRAGILRNPFLYPVALAASILLSACAGPSAPQAQNPKPPKREYVVYRIDDHRYITIESRYPCINGQIDGEIYYYDTRQNIRTPVAYTGDADNGLYRGYYAIHADSNYVAIPSLSFSQTNGMMLHINYSRDGGRTFQWFLVGGSVPNLVLIQENNLLYLARKDPDHPQDYSHEGASLLNFNQIMDQDIAHYRMTGSAFSRYGKDVTRGQIPFDLKSPSGETHWTCPAAQEK